uniref:ERCC4 domain-containing protein n=1 Tax=Kalanchoe fedtschenkoi TaxID=63787 RepID=A0A7N0TSV3_KALFE
MSTPIVLSDDEKSEDLYATPPLPNAKKRRSGTRVDPVSVFVIDDDPTPQKSRLSATPSVVKETPLSDLVKSDVSLVNCTYGSLGNRIRASSSGGQKLSGISSFICLSDNESDGGLEKMNEAVTGLESDGLSEWSPSPFRFKAPALSKQISNSGCTRASTYSDWISDAASMDTTPPQDDVLEGKNASGNVQLDETDDSMMADGANMNAKRKTGPGIGKKRQTKEEKMKLMEEKKLKREQEKLQKAALKAEEAERKKLGKEKKKWEKGKFALKSIVAEVDRRIVEQGSTGGHLLSRFAEKGLSFRITSNPIERSIIWSVAVPEELSELTSSQGTEIQYVSVVLEADEFCSLVTAGSFMDHVSRVQTRYPTYTVCYIINRLMSYIHKREQEQYKNPDKSSWRRPPVEEVLSKLTTHFCRVRSRLCVDEAELAEHVVGLTSSLASCQFRNKLTRLTVNANGSMIPKDFVNKNLIKKNLWLKALVVIPKVQPRFAVAIWKKYPTMRSLLNVYMDPSKTVHEKEFLLKDLPLDGLLGDQRRLGEVCSKRVYRILMAQSPSIKTDDVELGADFFTGRPS